jgi:hypothetical protein
MAESVKARWDQSRFNRTFKRYMQFSSRDAVTAINTKAYYIARKAVWFTHKADKGKVESALGKYVALPSNGKSKTQRKRIRLVKGTKHNAPLAALIINKRRGKLTEGGKGGLYGKEMARAIREMLMARFRSIAYIKSGWLPAIKALAKFADKRNEPGIDFDSKQIGNPKGSGTPANLNETGKTIATIINETWTKHDPGGAAMFKYGASGLQKAFNDEAGSMTQYIKDKLKAAEKDFNAAQR